ncbi:MAG: response regulator [Deltaproteobacteria bacterium]|nr:response regulator [Deltaproteobacteria bacterium]
MNDTIRVLIVDESPICRDTVSSSLSEADDITLLGAVPTGATGLARAIQQLPDVIIVSATLPDIDGAEFARSAIQNQAEVGVLLAVEAKANPETVDRVIRTLEAGAFDFFSKPPEGEPTRRDTLARRLLSKIRAFSAARYSKRARALAGHITSALDESTQRQRANALLRRQGPAGVPEVVLLAISTGGPEALKKLMPSLPASFPVPIVVAIHLPNGFTASLARSLNKSAPLEVVEAIAGALLEPGSVYLGGGSEHFLIARDLGGHLVLETNQDPPLNGCRPSADYLFRSAVKAQVSGVIGLVMTGMGTDGLAGLKELRDHGKCYVIAQDEQTSVVWGMPGSVVRSALQDEVLPLEEIGPRLVALANTPLGDGG